MWTKATSILRFRGGRIFPTNRFMVRRETNSSLIGTSRQRGGNVACVVFCMLLMILSSWLPPRRSVWLVIVLLSEISLPRLHAAAAGPGVSGSFASITAGSIVNLSSTGENDWVHWGLYTETSLD